MLLPDDQRRTLREHLRRPLPVLTIAMALVAACGLASEIYWGFELMTHFAMQQLVIGLVVAAACAGLRAWPWAAVSLVPVVIGVWQVGPSYVAPERPVELTEPLRVLTFNVHGGTDNEAEVMAFVRSSECDVALLLEVIIGRDEALAKIDGYRVAVVEARPDNFGLALLTRLPDLQAELVRLPDSDVAAIAATVPWKGETWHLLGIHTWPPIGGDRAKRRNAALRFAAEWAGGDGHRIVLGDLNTSPYSPHFRGLLRSGNLVDSRRGFGVQATWPQWPWYLAGARIPVDHILHDPGVTTTARRVGPSLGSDHRPVIATLAAAR